MKSVLLLVVIIFQSAMCFAQGPQGEHKIPEFKSNEFVGIIKYFEEDVFKNTKIKKDETKKTISSLIRAYNLKIDEIALLNKDVMDISEINVNEKIRSYELTKDETDLRDCLRKTMENLSPIKEKIEVVTKKLDVDFESVMSSKQFKKWKKFKKAERLKLQSKNGEVDRSQQSLPRSQSPFNRNNRNQRMRGY